MSVDAGQVKALREATGAGMMECKRALVETEGNFDLAIEKLRKEGAAKAVKKAGRIAADGIIVLKMSSDAKQALLLEVNCETDFVARDTHFTEFTQLLAEAGLQAKARDLNALMQLSLPGKGPVEEARQALVAKVGEHISVRRVAFIETEKSLGAYLHGNRIGALVELEGAPELAKDIAMHVAASKPLVVTPSEVPADAVAKEKEIFMAQAAGSGKSQDIIEKMVNGRLKKFLDEVSLLGQPFIKDPNVTVSELLSKHRGQVLRFVRFEVGEGIEKEKEDFVAAVMSQIQGG